VNNPEEFRSSAAVEQLSTHAALRDIDFTAESAPEFIQKY